MADEDTSSILYYNSLDGKELLFKDDSSWSRCISKVLTSVYSYSRMHGTVVANPGHVFDIDITDIESLIDNLHRYIFGIPYGSLYNEQPLIEGSFMWAQIELASNSPRADIQSTKRDQSDSQFNSYIDGIHEGRSFPAMKSVLEEGKIPVIINGMSLNDFIDGKKRFFESSIVGLVLNVIKTHSMKSKKKHPDIHYSILADELSKMIFLFSLAKNDNGKMTIDLTPDTVADRFSKMIEYISNTKKNSTTLLNDKIHNIVYDSVKGRQAYSSEEKMISLLGFEPRCQEQDCYDSEPISGQSVVRSISPNSSLRALVEAQYTELSIKRSVCSPNHSLGTYVNIKNIGNKPLSDFVFDILVRQNESVLVHGSGGMGKSTVSNIVYQWLYQEFIEDDNRTAPIIISPWLISRVQNASWNSRSDATREIITILIEDYPGASDIILNNRADVVFFVDGVDEYYSPGMIEIIRILGLSRVCPVLITGRSEVFEGMEDAFDNHIDLKKSIDKDCFKQIFEKYTDVSFESAITFIDDLSGLESTPLMAALVATYLSKNPLDEHQNAPSRIMLYDYIVTQTIQDKIYNVNQACSSSLTHADMRRIAQEYAWSRYLVPIGNVDYRIECISMMLGIDADAVRASVDAFTEKSFPNDRRFLHMSVQDYLVSCWIIDEIGNDTFREDVFKVVFRTPVNRFLGEAMNINPEIASGLAHWCDSMYEFTGNIDNVLQRDNYRAKILNMMGRAAITGDQDAINTLNHRNQRIFRESDVSSPQYEVALITEILHGRMDIEFKYVDLLKSNSRFAEITRILHLMYHDDVFDSIEFRDIEHQSIDRSVRRFLQDITPKMIRSDINVLRMCRIHAITIRMLFEGKYECREDLARALASIDVESLCKDAEQSPIITDLNKYRFDPKDYIVSLETELSSLKNAVASWILSFSS